MAEEHRCEAPEGHRLCANNCGFFGSSATMNLCSKCYRDVCLKEQQQASIKSTVENSLSASASSSSSSSSSAEPVPLPFVISPVASVELQVQSPVADPPAVETKPQPSRCFACRKRVGLTGFRCKCGTTFCGVHRYPEKHACTYDFKKVGREEIARDNPIVKADKLQRI